MSKEKNAVAVKQDTAVQQFNEAELEQYAGAGMEDADQESFAIPFLRIVQKLSPAIDQGAKAGQFINSATGETFDGAAGLLAIPCYYKRSFIKWSKADAGADFLGEISADDPIVATAKRNDKGQMILPDGACLTDTRSHYMLILNPSTGALEPVLMTLTSSQIKKSRNWLTAMNNIKIKGGTGKLFTPPTFSHIYKLTTKAESNDKGTWHGLVIEKDKVVDNASTFELAKQFHDQVRGGKVKTEVDVEDSSTNAEPF